MNSTQTCVLFENRYASDFGYKDPENQRETFISDMDIGNLGMEAFSPKKMVLTLKLGAKERVASN